MNTQILFGFPEFWEEFNRHFGPFICCLKRAEIALNGLIDRKWSDVDGRQRVILNLTRLNGVALEELIILAANGCGHGAMKILRSILETTIDAAYLQHCPAQFDYYLDWRHVEFWKWLVYLKKHAPHDYDKIDLRVRESAKYMFDNVCKKFQKTNSGKLRNRWCGINLRAEAEKVDLGNLYVAINPLAGC